MSVNNLDVLNIAGYKFEPLDDFEDLVPEFQSVCVEFESKRLSVSKSKRNKLLS